MSFPLPKGALGAELQNAVDLENYGVVRGGGARGIAARRGAVAAVVATVALHVGALLPQLDRWPRLSPPGH